MFGNPAAERAAIETTYEDAATVFRASPQTGGDQITRSIFSEVYADVACALSYAGAGASGQTRAQNTIDYDAVLFAAPELCILPGDRIDVRRFGRGTPCGGRLLHFAVVGRPAVYATHQEITVKDGDLA